MTEHLNEEQLEVYEEAIKNPSKNLALPMGFGKTLTSMCIILHNLDVYGSPALVVCSKSLLGSWENEIKKFFGEDFPYKILHKDYSKDLTIDDNKLFLCTPDAISKEYQFYGLKDRLTVEEYIPESAFALVRYIFPQQHEDVGKFYSRKWSTIVIDEAQNYINITTKTCKALIGLCSHDRRLLSGTMIDDPKMTKLFGYYMLSHVDFVPNCLIRFSSFVREVDFGGVKSTAIYREKTKSFDGPKVNEIIVKNGFTPEELVVYIMMKECLISLYNDILSEQDLPRGQRRGYGRLLSMVTKVRQCTLCPVLPLASSMVGRLCDASDIDRITTKNLSMLEDYLNNEDSVKSSRIKSQIETLDKIDEKVIIFSTFKTYLEILKHYINGREIFELKSSDKIERRMEKINAFSESKDAVLLMTYAIGCEGLNLQSCQHMFICDFWWNCAKTQQAIHRIYRPGQLAKEIFIYYFTSNTAMEQAILKKQNDKMKIGDAIMDGKYQGSVGKMSLKQIIKMVNMETNENLIKENKYY